MILMEKAKDLLPNVTQVELYIYLNDTHFFKVKARLGEEFYSYVELLALKLFINTLRTMGFELHIFGGNKLDEG